MKQWLAGLLTLTAMTLATVAGAVAYGARTYYVAPDGIDEGAGRSFGGRWRTIGYANATAECTADSDAVILVYGSYRSADADWNGPTQYTDFPNPANAAAQPRRFYFYGNLGCYDGNGTTIGTNYRHAVKPRVSIRGFRIMGDMVIDSTARRDSLADCMIDGGLAINGADSMVVADCDILGKRFTINANKRGGEQAFADTVVYCTMPNLSAADSVAFAIHPYSRTLYFAFNQIGIANWGESAYAARQIAGLHKSTFYANKWTTDLRATGGADDAYAYALDVRDASDSLTFRRDTLYAHTPRRTDVAQSAMLNAIMLPALGTEPGSVFGCTVDSSYWSCNGLYGVYGQDVMRKLTITNSVIVASNGMALKADALSGALFNHNTFVGDNYGRRWNGTDSIPAPAAEAGIVNLFGTFVGDTTKFLNNTVYNMRPAAPSRGVNYERTVCAVLPSDSTTFQSRWNAYGPAPYETSPGDGSLLTIAAGRYYQRTPAAFASLYSGVLNDSVHTEWLPEYGSTWGSLQFDFGGRDSVFKAATAGTDSLFNPRLGPLSVAIGIDSSGADVGARPYDAVPNMTLSATTIQFTPVVDQPDTAYVTIGNVGTDSLRITSVTTGDTIVAASVAAAAIGPGKTTTLEIIVTPAAYQSQTTYVGFYSDDPNKATQYITILIYFEPVGFGRFEE